MTFARTCVACACLAVFAASIVACPRARPASAPLVATPATSTRDDAGIAITKTPILSSRMGFELSNATGRDEKAATPITTPPKITLHVPSESGPAERAPMILLELDQAIDRAAILRFVRVEASSREVATRLATDAEIEADELVSALVMHVRKDHFVALRTLAPLPLGTAVEVTLKKGASSGDGARTTTDDQSFTFTTDGPLKLVDVACIGECSPGAAVWLQFTSPIDKDALDPGAIAFEPKAKILDVFATSDGIQVDARLEGRTHYAVHVAKGIRDAFGQTLAADATMGITVGAASAELAHDGDRDVVLPAGTKVFPIKTVEIAELRARVFAVGPDDYTAFRTYVRAFDDAFNRNQPLPPPPFREVAREALRPKPARGPDATTPLDLQKAIPDTTGHAIVLVEPRGAALREHLRPLLAWIQVTDIGVDTIADPDGTTVWATSLLTGKSMPGVRVMAGAASATTDASGLATLTHDTPSTIVARAGADVALVPPDDDHHPSRHDPNESIRFFVVSDRNDYTPGEEAKIHGYVRRMRDARRGDLEPIGAAESHRLTYEAIDAGDRTIAKGEIGLDPEGGFDFAIPLPKDTQPDRVRILMQLGGKDGPSFDRPLSVPWLSPLSLPVYEVAVATDDAVHVVGDRATATAQVFDDAGNAFAGARLHWSVTVERASFAPPNRAAFHFGPPADFPFWYGRERETQATGAWDSTTDAHGAHALAIDFDAPPDPYPRRFTLDASATSAERKGAGRDSASIFVHPSDTYVGIAKDTRVVAEGARFMVRSIVTSIDGKPLGGRRVTFRRAPSYFRGHGRDEDVAFEPAEAKSTTCTATSDAKTGEASCAFDALAGMQRVVAVVTDSRGRKNQSAIDIWATGGPEPPSPTIQDEDAQVLLDKTEYVPGDTAHVFVRAPFAPAEGVLTIAHQGVVRKMTFHAVDRVTKLDLPIDDSLVPNVDVGVLLVGAGSAHARGTTSVGVAAKERVLAVEVTPKEARVSPGGATDVTITVKDARGAIVPGASVTVAIVDESNTAAERDPIAALYEDVDDEVSVARSREHLVKSGPDSRRGRRAPFLRGPPETMSEMMAKERRYAKSVAAAEDRMPSKSARERDLPAQSRAHVPPLAAYFPRLVTDARGVATANVRMPGAVARYRVIAVTAARGRAFGVGEATLTVRR